MDPRFRGDDNSANSHLAFNDKTLKLLTVPHTSGTIRDVDLGIIGNCQYNALIDTAGRVVWLCWPRFDSPPIFAHLLDDEKGGAFEICPERETYTVDQKYIENTNILTTRFTTDTGTFDLIDFAPRFFQYERYYKPTNLVRIVRKVEGDPRIRVTCQPTQDYARQKVMSNWGSNHITFEGYEHPVRLTTNAPLTYISESRAFTLKTDMYFVLTWGTPLHENIEETCNNFLQRTTQYWRKWVKHCAIPRDFQSEVIRSALVLKLHQYDDTGAIIAASTTSIPEAEGTARNWDYRYCWLRDSFFTLSAFQRLGHFEEMESFVSYLRNICDVRTHAHNGLQPVYALNGDCELTEIELPHLKGYRGHRPVRIGNQAYSHVQNDVYGEMLLAISPLFLDQRLAHASTTIDKPLLNKLLMALEEHFEEKDAGVWEFRGQQQLHTFSLLMNWAGVTKAHEISITHGLEDIRVKTTELMERARIIMDTQCWDKNQNMYTQAQGSTHLDASLLMLVNLGYLDPHSERAKYLVDKIIENLATPEGFVYRYKHEDDFGVPQNTFTICSFWLVEALARLGELYEAKKIFRTVTQNANHLGLLSEDINPATKEQWGNFPQVYSHVGLINSAYLISRPWF